MSSSPGLPIAAGVEAPAERCGADEQFLDYILTTYEPRAPFEGRLRSVNALYRTFELGGVGAEGRRSVECLRTGLGRFRTVWGAKQDHRSGAWAWEYYFYDFERQHADLSLEAVVRHLAPAFRVDARLCRPTPWMMFSVDCSPAILRGEEAAAAHVYVASRSYRLAGDDLELENVYHFHPPREELAEILMRLRQSPLHSAQEAHLGRILLPELVSCGSICVAYKRRADAVYFSRITTAQLVAGLRQLAWPAALVDWLDERTSELDHLLWDLGFDFRCDPDGSFHVDKSGFYGSF